MIWFVIQLKQPMNTSLFRVPGQLWNPWSYSSLYIHIFATKDSLTWYIGNCEVGSKYIKELEDHWNDMNKCVQNQASNVKANHSRIAFVTTCHAFERNGQDENSKRLARWDPKKPVISRVKYCLMATRTPGSTHQLRLLGSWNPTLDVFKNYQLTDELVSLPDFFRHPTVRSSTSMGYFKPVKITIGSGTHLVELWWPKRGCLRKERVTSCTHRIHGTIAYLPAWIP